MAALSKPFVLLGLLGVVVATWVDPAVLNDCPGYKAENVLSDGSTLTADLSLDGEPCNVFGADIQQLKLEVTHETGPSSVLVVPLKSTDSGYGQTPEYTSRSPTQRWNGIKSPSRWYPVHLERQPSRTKSASITPLTPSLSRS